MVATRSTAFDWSIQNVEAFQRKLDELGKATNDFRIPLRLIASDFYRSNRKLFTLQSKGLYEDLSPKYKPVKQRKVGRIYPILKGESQDLANSILGKSHKYSIFTIGRRAMEMGSNVPYGKFHQSDKPRTTMPQRKFVFIDGGPADTSKDSSINGRRERWISILDTHIEQLVTGRIR